MFLQSFRLFSLSHLNTPRTSRPMQACTGHACGRESSGVPYALRYRPQTLLRTPPFPPFRRTHARTLARSLAHAHARTCTLKAHTHGTTTQQEATRTQRSGFTLLGEREPLRVKTEENYNIETENVRRHARAHPRTHTHTHTQSSLNTGYIRDEVGHWVCM